jgi:ABC-2 type transport system ATP-binding protein
MRTLIRRVGETKTVLLSTHVLPEVELTCDRVLIINQGKLVADGATQDILTRGVETQLTVGLAAGKVVATEAELVAQLMAIEGVTRAQVVAPVDESRRLVVRARCDVRQAIFKWAVGRGHVLVELASDKRNLEDVFERLTLGVDQGDEE